LVGLSSFLLISFWFTRFETSLGGLLALFMNRLGDIFFIIGIIISLLLFGSTDIIILNSHPEFNSDILLIFLFLAAMTKSAQLSLHLWLPKSMEGWNQLLLFKIYDRDEKGRFIKGDRIKENRDKDITEYQKQAIIGLLLSNGYIRGKILHFTFKADHLEFTK